MTMTKKKIAIEYVDYVEGECGTYPLDPATGMPTLPEGQFWRVTPESCFSYSEVQLREKTWYGSKKLKSTTTHLYKESVLGNAAFILDNLSTYKPDMSLLGDYPPLSL